MQSSSGGWGWRGKELASVPATVTSPMTYFLSGNGDIGGDDGGGGGWGGAGTACGGSFGDSGGYALLETSKEQITQLI